MDSYTLEQARIANRAKREEAFNKAKDIVKNIDRYGRVVIETKNFTVTLWSSNDDFNISVNPTKDRGSFEHNRLGEDCGGGLWFRDNKLIDYDGVYYLPKEVVTILKEQGINTEYVED